MNAVKTGNGKWFVYTGHSPHQTERDFSRHLKLTHKYSYIFKSTFMFKVAWSLANRDIAHSFLKNAAGFDFFPYQTCLLTWLFRFCCYFCPLPPLPPFFFTWFFKFSWKLDSNIWKWDFSKQSILLHTPFLFLKYSYFIKKFCCLYAMI